MMNGCQRFIPILVLLFVLSSLNSVFQTTAAWQITLNYNHNHLNKLKLNLYREFIENVWEDLQQDCDLVPSLEYIPNELRVNSVPSRAVPDCDVTISAKALTPNMNNIHSKSKSNSNNPIRLVRFGLLETKNRETGVLDLQSGKSTHVLNFVIFPQFGRADLPVFGADLVTLPGGKHLVAIDFQPLLVDHDDNGNNDDNHRCCGLLCLPKDIESELDKLHQKYSTQLEWGGDIPIPARRYFSKYALWTRLSDNESNDGDNEAGKGKDGIMKINSVIKDAFNEYLKVYKKLILSNKMSSDAADVDVDNEDIDDKKSADVINNFNNNKFYLEGQKCYIVYRRKNDPARPMLKALYGEEFAERIIHEVFFRD